MKYLTKSVVTIIILTTILSCSQNQRIKAGLRNVDQLVIQYFKPTDTLTHKTSDEDDIDLFIDLVAGSDVQVDMQDTTGRIQFTKKGSPLLEVYFSTPSTGSKFNAPYYSFLYDQDMHGGRFTYRAGQFLEVLYHQLRVKKLTGKP